MLDWESSNNKFKLQIFKWNSIFLFEYFKKKRKIQNKNLIVKNNMKYNIFKKEIFNFKIKFYFLLYLNKIIRIKNSYHEILQELRLIIKDLLYCSIINIQNHLFLKCIKRKYNVYVDLNIGGGKITVMFFILIDHSWCMGKKNYNFLLFNSILLTLKNSENINQILKLTKTSSFFFNNFFSTIKSPTTSKKKRGYGIFFIKFKKKKSTLYNCLIRKKIKRVLLCQVGYDIPMQDLVEISKILSEFTLTKIQFIFLNSKHIVQKLKIIISLIKSEFKINRKIIMWCASHSLYIFEKSFSKICKLINILSKNFNRCIIFLNSKKRCIILKKIIKNYFKKYRTFPSILTKHFSSNNLKKAIFLISDTILDTCIKIKNLDYILNYDIPIYQYFYYKRISFYEDKKILYLIFFLVYEMFNYQKILKMVFNLKIHVKYL
jgi:hypothetical protein